MIFAITCRGRHFHLNPFDVNVDDPLGFIGLALVALAWAVKADERHLLKKNKNLLKLVQTRIHAKLLQLCFSLKTIGFYCYFA